MKVKVQVLNDENDEVTEMFLTNGRGDSFILRGTKKDLDLFNKTRSKIDDQIFPLFLYTGQLKSLAKNIGLEIYEKESK